MPSMKPTLPHFLLLSVLVVGCGTSDRSTPAEPRTFPIERFDPRMDDLIAPGTEVDVLADGFAWAEGPVWIPNGGYLLFSDVPNNRINKWSEDDGLSVWLEPSGYTGSGQPGSNSGSNGLALDTNGELVLAQHGDRRIARLAGGLGDPSAGFVTVVDRYDGKRLNSPNDLVFDSKGNLYFTDPPFGLDQMMNDPSKELGFSGVFRLNSDGSIDLIDDSNSFPNGVALSPDERTLYVTDTDPDDRLLIAYDVAADGTIGHRRIFADMSVLGDGDVDGLKVDSNGNIWTTGPGGIRIFAPDGTALGAILIGPCANLAWGGDGSTLYLAAASHLMRVATLARVESVK